eukprot:2472214-Pyramimonas_sp.AAC.1
MRRREPRSAPVNSPTASASFADLLCSLPLPANHAARPTVLGPAGCHTGERLAPRAAPARDPGRPAPPGRP